MKSSNGSAVYFEDASGLTKIWFCLLADARQAGRGRQMARTLISRELNVPLSSIAFTCEGGTKPLIENRPSVWFNLSICDNAVVVAVSTANEIGVDTCAVVDGFAYESIVETFFSSPEQVLLSKVAKSERTLEFFRLWSRKEAVVKLFGLGIAKVNLCDLDVSRNQVEFYDQRSRCQVGAFVTDIYLGSHHRVSVATAKPLMLTQMRQLTLNLCDLPVSSEASK